MLIIVILLVMSAASKLVGIASKLDWYTHSSTTLRNPFSMTYKNKMTIYSFIIRHSFPNLLYVTYLHDVLYVCASSICFCSPKGTIMKIRSILTCIMLSCHSILIVKLLDAYIDFCKVVFYTHLLYLFCCGK